MAYNELIKNFNRIRDYMREFYVFGFKSREEYRKKSTRSYDDERRRMESWMGDLMQFRQTPEGKNVFLSVDSRISYHNPLYKAWKTKSFTDGDITLHFLLLDCFASSRAEMSFQDIVEQVDHAIAGFEHPHYFDESTIRKKLKEYLKEGILISGKKGKMMYYRRVEDCAMCSTDALHFFSEIAPCGVVGSYLLDQQPVYEEHIGFKHHYITGALDSEILRLLFQAMNEKKYISLEVINRKKDRSSKHRLVPLRIMNSVQNGRQYLMAYWERTNRITSYRIDNILSVALETECGRFEELREDLKRMQPYMWGVSTQSMSKQRMEYVEFVVRYGQDEPFIHKRLEREKRCGTVEKISEFESRFQAEIYDASELIPWIRTFICRITEIRFSNKQLEAQFYEDMEAMYRLYGLEDSSGRDKYKADFMEEKNGDIK